MQGGVKVIALDSRQRWQVCSLSAIRGAIPQVGVKINFFSVKVP